MNTEKIERVQTDLQTLRNAMNLDLPYDERDIWPNIGIAISLLPPIALGFSGRLSGVGWLSFLPFAVVVLFIGFQVIRRSFSRQTNVGKKEFRFELILGMIFLASNLALKKWVSAAGLPEMVTPAVLFLPLGLLFCMLPYWNRTHLSYLGWGFTFLALGLTAPFCPKEYWRPFAMCVAILGFLSTAGIMRWQLNRTDQSSYRG